MDEHVQFWVTVFGGGVIIVFLIAAQFFLVFLSEIPNKWYRYWLVSLVSIIGATAGWFLGVLATPHGDQGKQFTVVGSAVASFFSGFLASKLNDIWKDVFGQVGKSTVIIPLAFAGAWLLVAFTFTFLTRTFTPVH